MAGLKALGYGALGIAFLVNAVESWRGEPKPDTGLTTNGLRGLKRKKKGAALAAAPARRGPKHTQTVDVRGIDQRVKILCNLVCKGGIDPEIHELASKIVSQKCGPKGNQKWCSPEKNSLAETLALFRSVKDPNSPLAIRYTGDMGFADTFTGAKRTLKKKGSGDCDDFAVSLGALLVAIGHPVKLRIIQTQGKASWSHVYLITPKDHYKPDGPWIAVDASVNKPLGWEAPGAAECARTGQPAGMCVRVKDFAVECRGKKAI